MDGFQLDKLGGKGGVSMQQLSSYLEMFSGTLSQASAHPWEIVKVALRLNAGAVILAHNHPSG